MLKRKIAFIVILTTIALSACSTTSPDVLRSSGSKSAVATMHIIATRTLRESRPSAVLGTFTSLFTSQGIFLPVKTAQLGIEAQKKMMEALSSPVTDETFALLIEVGNVLQVDIIDALNRSSDRARFLDDYLQSLRNAGSLIERKMSELQELQEQLGTKRKEQRNTARDTSRELKNALKEQNYAPAAELEQLLAEQNGALAETETKEKQAKDIFNRFKALRDIAAEKLQAIENNREIILAGLKVIDVPGIEDLRILEEGAKWERNKKKGIFTKPR